MATDPRFKYGDIVRSGFSITGRVTRLLTQHGMEWVVIFTGERYTRKVPASSVQLITTCENTDWIRDGSGEIVRVERCVNPPTIRIPGGIWICRECDEGRKWAK